MNDSRRTFIRTLGRVVVAVALGGIAVVLGRRRGERRSVWQLDPHKCIACGRCATQCVLAPSAVKSVHAFAMCGYCALCTGYFPPEPPSLTTAAENQLCPVGAIRRRYVEDPYFEYTINESLCIGCGKCVKGCGSFGNGSLFLQARHDRCLNCNECAIAQACPAGAWQRVPAEQAYLLKDRSQAKPRSSGRLPDEGAAG